MRIYNILSRQNNKMLFEGQFGSFVECLERAVEENIDLGHADLRQRNLSNASLDDAWLTHADFTGANLGGANLSEARLSGARFTNAGLYNTCLAYSDMQHCRFEHAGFGATDIAGSNISFSRFAGLSCFSLDFTQVSAMKGCRFESPCAVHSVHTSCPPVVITGLHTTPLVIIEDQITMENKWLLS